MAARFWVGGTGNLDGSTTTHISSSSGGAGGASYPGPGDTLTLDANSGAGAVVTVTASTTVGAVNIGTSSSVFSGTLILNAPLNATAASGGTGQVTLTSGTFNTNGQTCSWVIFNGSGAATRALTLGASLLTVTGNVTPWTFAVSTGLTFTCGTSRITCSGSGLATFATGGQTFYDVVVSNVATSAFTISGGGATFHDLTVNGGNTPQGSLAIVGFTVTGTFTVAGQSNINRLLVQSTNVGARRTITAAVVVPSNVAWQDIAGAGAAAPFTGTSMGDAQGNANIQTADPLNLYRVGAGGNWSDPSFWFTDDVIVNEDLTTTPATPRVPLPQDAVVVDSRASGTIVVDMPRLGRGLDLSGFPGTFSLSGGINATVYGPLTVSSDPAFAFAGTQDVVLGGRGGFLFATNGKALTGGVRVLAPGGVYTLADDLVAAGAFTLTNGTFDADGHDVTVASLNSSTGGNIRELAMGSGTWTLTGTGTVWTVTTNPALVITPGGSTIVISDTSATAKVFVGNGRTYRHLTFNGGAGTLTMGGSTFGTVTYAAGASVILTAGTVTTVGDLVAHGALGQLITITSSSNGVAATFTKTGGTVVADYLSLKDSAATGTAQWFAGAHSVNVSGNSGWQFAAPAAGTNRLLALFPGRG